MKKVFVFATLCVAFLFSSCEYPGVSGGTIPPEPVNPDTCIISTGVPLSVGNNTALLSGNAQFDSTKYVQYGMIVNSDSVAVAKCLSVYYYAKTIENGMYQIELVDLEPQTKYYYRAFCIIEKEDKEHKEYKDTIYGDIEFFVTQEDFSNSSGNSNPSGGSGHLVPSNAFSVSYNRYVCFSGGNLQFHLRDSIWRFAENQWSTIENYSDTAWGDLFLWENFGNDWIGYDNPNTWRTLSIKEWNYLLEQRNNSAALHGIANVNGVNGMVLLPDSWKCPSGLMFTSGFSNYGAEYYGKQQTYNAEEWRKMEMAGAVFLPAAGYWSSYMGAVGTIGFYWSQTQINDTEYPYYYTMRFQTDQWEIGRGQDGSDPWNGCFYYSVRLVKDIN